MRAKHARVSSMYKQITYTHKYTHEHMNRYRDRERQGEKQTNKYEKIQKERGEKERDPSNLRGRLGDLEGAWAESWYLHLGCLGQN